MVGLVDAFLSARLALEEAVRDQLTATAILLKSLGGGWDESGRHVSAESAASKQVVQRKNEPENAESVR